MFMTKTSYCTSSWPAAVDCVVAPFFTVQSMNGSHDELEVRRLLQSMVERVVHVSKLRRRSWSPPSALRSRSLPPRNPTRWSSPRPPKKATAVIGDYRRSRPRIAPVIPSSSSSSSSPRSASPCSSTSSSTESSHVSMTPVKPVRSMRSLTPSRFNSTKYSMSFAQFLFKQLFVSDSVEASRHGPPSGNQFAKVPPSLERLMLLGFFICLDEFLYVFTILPLRLLAFALRVTRSSTADVLRALLIFICCSLLAFFNITFSSIYHLIRGQNFFKLYVLFNILTIFDKLCCSLGEDILDSLFYSAQLRFFSFKTLLDLIIASIYMVIHSLVLYLQIVSLNVAINSNNSALVSLLISNNFLELKSNVFKKYTKAQLFQIASSDIVERFHLTLFILVILIANVSNLVWHSAWNWLVQAAQLSIILVSLEILVDWIKHSCMVKFNSFPVSVYRQFFDVLCADFAHGTVASRMHDAPHAVSRRLGFISIPIACVLLRGVNQAVSLPRFAGSLPQPFVVAVAILIFCILLALKVVINLSLLGVSAALAVNPPSHVQTYRTVERYSVFVAAPTNIFA